MRLLGIGWVGTATSMFDETSRFFGEIMGLPIAERYPHNVVFTAENGDRIEVFRPESRPFFTTGPVVEFLVDDVERARSEMESAGIAFLGPVGSFGGYSWTHFRGPDGNVYGLTSPAREAGLEPSDGPDQR